jgi:hypothetical protein
MPRNAKCVRTFTVVPAVLPLRSHRREATGTSQKLTVWKSFKCFAHYLRVAFS